MQIRSKSTNKLQLFILFAFSILISCNKALEKTQQPSISRSEAFFALKQKLSPETEKIYLEIKAADARTHFVEKLPATAGTPIWDKILIRTTQSKNLGSLITAYGKSVNSVTKPTAKNVVIPLNEGNQYLSAVVTAVLFPDSSGIFECTTTDKLRSYVFEPTISKKETKEFLTMFMFMENRCFGTSKFVNMPRDLFPEAIRDTATGLNIVEFKFTQKAVNQDGSQTNAEPEFICLRYKKSAGSCTCYNGICIDWWLGCSACGYSDCFYFQSVTGNSVWEPPTNGIRAGASDNVTLPSGGPGSLYDNVFAPCGGTFYSPQPCDTDHSVLPLDNYDPGEDAMLYFGNSDPIELDKFMNCFNNVPSTGATYSLKMYVFLPNLNDLDELVVGRTPGHVMISMTKTNGNNSVTQTFGFYPRPSHKSILMGKVTPKVVNDQNHESHGYLQLPNLTETEFTAAKNKAISSWSKWYDLNDYNCANYALEVFNAANSGTAVSIPDTCPGMLNYGKTPNGLYKYILQQKNNGNTNAKIETAWTPSSQGPCN